MSNYFSREMNAANEHFMNADGKGWSAADMYGGDIYGNDGDYFSGQTLLNAGGNSGRQDSQPYIIKVQNSTTNDVSSVTILDAAVKQFDFSVAGISITYGLSNITYQQFLAKLVGGFVFEVGQVRLKASATSTTNANDQVLTETTIKMVDINGNEIKRTFIPELDNYAQVLNQTDMWYNFVVDSLTSMTFATLYASTTLTVKLFPKVKTNDVKGLVSGGRNNVTGYNNPGTNPFLARLK